METKDRLLNAKANFAFAVSRAINRRLGRNVLLEDLSWIELEQLNWLSRDGNVSDKYLERALNDMLEVD